jgi:hypothetical protein
MNKDAIFIDCIFIDSIFIDEKIYKNICDMLTWSDLTNVQKTNKTLNEKMHKQQRPLLFFVYDLLEENIKMCDTLQERQTRELDDLSFSDIFDKTDINRINKMIKNNKKILDLLQKLLLLIRTNDAVLLSCDINRLLDTSSSYHKPKPEPSRGDQEGLLMEVMEYIESADRDITCTLMLVKKVSKKKKYIYVFNNIKKIIDFLS